MSFPSEKSKRVVSSRLPNKQELRRIKITIDLGTLDEGPYSMVDNKEKIDSLVTSLSTMLLTPHGADLLSIILPSLIDIADD